ncbi:Pentatricopeptide repeat-containing protein, chloroplastic [Sesamum alatum]|uniref:Pentatricopeptide repeat-containing protein, chloroplastic n=1 Tax=Sesamum alatum TaxID=300844 RepID=A0AAE1XPC7_9LAMI|nr:Pentatricopeptide repeat-containing protein, chloroplastic [Sesamum alatum]
MASLKLSVTVDNGCYESKKQRFALNSLKFGSSTLFSGYVNTNGALIVKPFCKLKQIRVNRLENELLGASESKLEGCQMGDGKKYVAGDDNLILETPEFHGDSRKGRVNIWKKFRSTKTARKHTSRNLDVHRNGNKYKKEEKVMAPRENISAIRVLDGQTMVDLDFDNIATESRPERCNLILEQLEKSNGDKALRFFEWMKVNGKLKKNMTAYNLILRILGRKADWGGAEVMIREMVCDSGCELNYQTFNTLIYACYKKWACRFGS